MSAVKKKVLAEIEDRKDEIVRLCSDTIRIPSENPPGDTTELARFLTNYLEKKGIKVDQYEPKKGLLNLVATIEGTSKEPNFVLNAHMDVFPAEIGKPWNFAPFGGEIRDGKILGRGAVDMKGGMTASLFAFTLMKDLGIVLPGKITLMLVSDEESGGRWGTEWVLDNVPDTVGDACLNGEPTGFEQVTIGEKGTNSLKFAASGIPEHAAYKQMAADGNAIVKMAKALVTAVTLQQLGVRIPDEIKQVAEDTRAVTEAQLGKGIGANVDHVLVNPGTIKGRVKVNIVPAHCEAEVDIRVPWGVSTEQIRQELEERLKKAGVGDVRLEFFIRNEATYTSPSDRLVQIVRDNVRLQAGKLPRLAFKPGATDVRFFRRKGVPGVNVGPRNYGMGEVNEYTTVEDVVKVTAVHAGTIIDYFGL